MDAFHLSTLLPITINDNDLHQCPQLSKLLQKLSEKLSPIGLDHAKTEDLKRMNHTLNNEKQLYFQSKLVIDATKEVLDNLQKQPLNNDQDVEQRIQSLNLSKLIHLSETESLLSISDEHEKNLYGLTPENIYQCNAPTDIQNIEQFIQTNIYPEVEEKLQQKYDSLVQFFNPGSHSDIDELNQSQILNITMSGRYTLPNEINKMKKKIQTDKDNVQRECEKTFLNYWAYFRCLAESIDVLITILEDYKLKSFHEFDEVYLLHLRQTSHTMRLKLKVIEYQCINNTYNLNAVQYLKEMRALLEKEYESCLQQSDLVDKELEQYNVVGANFGKLVEEYTQLCQKIKLKKWELEQLEE